MVTVGPSAMLDDCRLGADYSSQFYGRSSEFSIEAAGGLAVGKIGASVDAVTTPPSSSESEKRPPYRRSDEPPSIRALHAALHDALRVAAPGLAMRWTSQARTILLLDGIDGEDSARVVEDLRAANALVEALLAAFASSDEESEAVISPGLRFGAEAFARGASLHHTAKALDLLVAMAMYAVEAAFDGGSLPHGTIADGIWLARRLQHRAALLSLAVTRGYTQAYGEALRDRFRHLRHDLRNPLGTIKSVLALMDDESVPAEARTNPNFRAMATRNARSLEEMIADRLGDAAAPLSVIAGQDVWVRTIACTVRRELRSEAEHRGVMIDVDPDGPRGQFDAPGLELLLRGALQAALREAVTGDRLRLEFNDTARDRALVSVCTDSGRPPIQDQSVLNQLHALAERIGALVTWSDRIQVSVAMRPAVHSNGSATEGERLVRRERVVLGDGETGHDLRSPREGDHGEANAL